MLNWDEYGKEEVNTSAVVTATKPVIETPQAAEQQPTPAPVNTVAETKSENVSIEEGSCLLYTSPSPRDVEESRMPSSA